MVPESRRALSGALVVFAALTLAACPPRAYDPPADPLTTPEAVLELARGYIAGGPGAAVIEARASQYSDRGGLKGKLEILLARPGRVRLTGLSPTDDMVSVLATDGHRFTFFERGQKSCFVGRACPENVGRFASIPLESDELVGVLLGRPPILPSESRTMTWDREVGGYRLDLVGGASDLGLAHGRVQRLWVAHGDGRVLRTAILEGGKTRVDVRYSEFAKRGEHLVPGRLDVRMARESTDLRLEYRGFEAAPELGDDAFGFTCPEGTTLEELPCEGGGAP